MPENQERQLGGQTVEQKDSQKYQAVVVDLNEYKRRRKGQTVPEIVLEGELISYVSETEASSLETPMADEIPAQMLDPKIVAFPSRLLIPNMEDYRREPGFPNNIVELRSYLKKKRANPNKAA